MPRLFQKNRYSGDLKPRSLTFGRLARSLPYTNSIMTFLRGSIVQANQHDANIVVRDGALEAVEDGFEAVEADFLGGGFDAAGDVRVDPSRGLGDFFYFQI